MKTFDDLVFYRVSDNIQRSYLKFENGFACSVIDRTDNIFGAIAGHNCYEIAVMLDGKVCVTTALGTQGVFAECDKKKVTAIMLMIQMLRGDK